MPNESGARPNAPSTAPHRKRLDAFAVKALRHKHLKLDQRKIDFAKRYFGVDSEQEAIDRALSLLMEEQRIVAKMKPLAGALRRDVGEWPYR